MNYDIDEKQTSIDNMSDTLFQRLLYHDKCDNVDDMKAIHDEWVVDSQDPEEGHYRFLFIQNFSIQP